MPLHRFEQVEDFWQQAQAYLLQFEAEHNLLLGVCHTLRHCPERYAEPPYLAIATTDAGAIQAIALQTPPYKLLLSQVEDVQALDLIAQDLQTHQPHLPGVSGLVVEAAAFAQIWAALTGQPTRRSMELRIHQLTAVQVAAANDRRSGDAIAPVPGQLRVATAGDRPLLVEWFTAFDRDVGGVMGSQVESAVDAGLKRQSLYLWELAAGEAAVNWQPTCLVGGSQSLPTAARIGPVYTPPEQRRKGYATACVAAVSQRLLDQGCRSCYLLTDLENPTSNHIYHQIGYRPICDWHDYVFEAR